MRDYIDNVSLEQYRLRGKMALDRVLVKKLNDLCNICKTDIRFLCEGIFISVIGEKALIKFTNCYEFINVNLQINGKTMFVTKYTGDSPKELLNEVYHKLREMDIEVINKDGSKSSAHLMVFRLREDLYEDLTAFLQYRSEEE